MEFLRTVTPDNQEQHMIQLRRFNMGLPGEADCLTEEHQVLTNHGFLFLSELEAMRNKQDKDKGKEDEWKSLLIASYCPEVGRKKQKGRRR